MKNIYILIGLPGAGKSTWTKDIIKASGLQDTQYVVLSRDIIRARLGYTSSVDEKALLDKAKEDKVTRVFDYDLEDAIYDTRIEDIIIDNINIKPKYRTALVEKVLGMNCNDDINFIYVVFNTPLDVCIERRDGQIDGDVMKDLYVQFRSGLTNIKSECAKYDIELVNINK